MIFMSLSIRMKSDLLPDLVFCSIFTFSDSNQYSDLDSCKCFNYFQIGELPLGNRCLRYLYASQSGIKLKLITLRLLKIMSNL